MATDLERQKAEIYARRGPGKWTTPITADEWVEQFALEARGKPVAYSALHPDDFHKYSEDAIQRATAANADAGAHSSTNPDFGIRNFAGGGGGSGLAQGVLNAPQNEFELASWLAQGRTPATPAHAAMGQAIGLGTGGYGRQLDQMFNSAGGPYGQLQAAAAYIAPAKYKYLETLAEQETERDQTDAFKRMFSEAFGPGGAMAGGGGVGGPLTSMQADSGSGVRIQPTNLQRYRPRRPATQGY